TGYCETIDSIKMSEYSLQNPAEDAADKSESVDMSQNNIHEVPDHGILASTSVLRTNKRTGSLQLNQVYYTWNDINAFVKGSKKSWFGLPDSSTNGKPKHILKSVSGMAQPGEILAIMGASGAGKTSLLNILTFRNTTLHVSGSRMINGVKISAEQLPLFSAYIQQDDVFFGTLSPREHLKFQALLRMDKDISYKERMRRVEEVIKEMGLTSCADTVIGIPGRLKGLSGGQQKRLSVASEVLTDPQLLICDEPTTGLDYFMAANLVKTLKSLANKGKTIICTIHQPASATFALFDKLLLLSEGRVAYFGGAQEAPAYFSSIGYPCPETYNPADFYIQTLAIRPGNVEECLERSNDICDKFANSDEAQDALQMAAMFERDDRLSVALKEVERVRKKSPFKASWCAQFRACLWRSWLTVLKDPLIMKIQLVQTIIVSLMIGILYYGQKYDQEGVQNITGYIFIAITFSIFNSIFPVANVFWCEIAVLKREHFNGTYRTDAYFLAKSIAELPIYLCMPAIFTSISYWLVGLNSDLHRFFTAVGISILVGNVGSSFGYLCSIIAPSFDVTMAIVPGLIMPFMLFGGFFLNKNSVPIYFIPIQYLSWFLYGNEAFSINQWKGVTNIDCGKSIVCQRTGEQVLENISFDEVNYDYSLTALGALILASRILSYVGLVIKIRRRS
ncbi:Protein white, partial [Orchesella cincta]